MKKVFIAATAFAVLLGILPFITGNVEKKELNDEARKGAPGKFVKLSDGLVHYEITGPDKGETVVLIHGNAAPSFSWDRNIKALSDAGFRILRYDQYGTGYSDRPDTAYTRELYDRQIVELLDSLSIKGPLSFAGTSQGGSVAVYFTAKHPDRVKRLALLSPYINILPMKAMLGVLRTPVIGDYLARIALDRNNLNYPEKVFTDKKNITEEFTEKYLTQLSLKGFKMARLGNFRGDALDDFTPAYKYVAKTGIPVLLTWGTADGVIKADSIKNIREAIPVLEYHEITGGGHFVHYENPEKVNGLLVKFLLK